MSLLCNCSPINSNGDNKCVQKCVQSPWSPDHQLLPPCVSVEWRLKHQDKKQRRPCLVLILLFKKTDRHPLPLQTQKINTALVKVDPLKFTLWGLRWGRGAPGSTQRAGSSLHSIFELHSLFSLCTTAPFVFSGFDVCLFDFISETLNKTTKNEAWTYFSLLKEWRHQICPDKPR